MSETNFRGRKKSEPFGIDDRSESFNESGSLVLDLCVHTKVCHQVDVVDFVLIRHRDRFATRDELVCDKFAHDVFVEGKSEFELTNVAFIMFHKCQTAIQIAVERSQLV